ncbi:MAG TPA: hypothetical protein VKZ63_13725 [Kofleriaceae bacterium]|nr:hypothetical protein [Kofleriaceae bacterium]
MKKLIWAGAVTVVSALGAALAVRALDAVWRRLTHEPPPGTPRWARLAGLPVRRKVMHSVQPPSM